MHLLIRAVMILSILISSLCQARPMNHCSPQEIKDIHTTIQHYLDKNAAISSREVTITSLQCVHAYASAKVKPKKPVTDTATVYLHNTDQHWEVMSLGTSFDEKFLSQLPKELR